MRNLTIGLFILAGYMGLGAWYHTCNIRDLCDGCTNCETNAPDQDSDQGSNTGDATAAFSPWTILGSNGQQLMQFDASDRFAKGGAEIELDSGAISVPDSVYQYLLRNPNQYLVVTGRYSKDEPPHPDGGNWGEARAKTFASQLVNRGVNPDRIKTRSQLEALRFAKDGSATNGLGLQFKELEGEQALAVEDHIAHKTLYCEFAQAEFIPDPSLVNYAAELKNYLTKYPNKKVTLTGHTDNEGSHSTNMSVGKKRARTVRDYFVSTGISSKRMSIFTKGERAPIASNDTDEGRAKNRRIEIVVQ